MIQLALAAVLSLGSAADANRAAIQQAVDEAAAKGATLKGINMKTERLETMLKLAKELDLSVAGFGELPPLEEGSGALGLRS